VRTRIALAISMFTVILVTLIYSTTSSGVSTVAQQKTVPTKAVLVEVVTEHQVWAAQRHPVVIPPPVVVVSQPVSTPTPAPAPVVAAPSAPTDLIAAWGRVAVCEEGGWGNYGFPNYPNSLGITAQNFYSAAASIGANPSDLSPANQVAIAQALVTSLGMSGWIPDQNGCAPW
jgi:hypothetical protein